MAGCWIEWPKNVGQFLTSYYLLYPSDPDCTENCIFLTLLRGRGLEHQGMDLNNAELS